MGKYSGKVLTVFISPSGVRVCEGENRGGNPDISKFFTVRGVSEYFSDTGSSRAPEIINLAGLVNAIVEACKEQHTTSRRVMICSDCFGIETVVDQNSNPGMLKGLATGDVKNIGKIFSGSKEETAPGRMVCKVSWGDLTQDGRVTSITTKTTGDKYMLKSLVEAFYEQGYDVIFISGSQEVLFNFWQTSPANFDSQGKIILDYDVEMRMTVFYKDIPVTVTTMNMVARDDILERMQNQIRSALVSTQRNPHIYLTGSVFADTGFYSDTIDMLESENYLVYDLFNKPVVPPDYDEKVRTGEIDPILTPDYSANIAMFMVAYSNKQLISLTPNIELGDMLRKNSTAVARIGLGVSCAALAISVVLAGLRCWDLYKMKTDPSAVDSLNQQVSSLNMRKQSLTSTIQTLTEADTTILELLKFVEANQTDRVAVVSIDTKDILDASMNVDDTATTAATTTAPPPETGTDAQATAGAETEEPVDGTVGGSSYVRENIIVRGYARTGNEAVSYFDRLFNYGLPGDPTLNGVQRYTLPDGDEVYAFEIEIAGGGLE